MNTPNYDKLLLATIDQLKESNAKPKLLVHVCCAPCTTYCLTQLLEAFSVTLYYANDNIYPESEWKKRLIELEKLARLIEKGEYENFAACKIELVAPKYSPQNFVCAAKGLEGEKEGGGRCTKCFEMRLTDTRDYALANGFDYFATTLTVSPYKNSRLLNEIGTSLQKENLLWLPADFKKRNGYQESIALSTKYGLYRQHYCGCEYSLGNLTERTQ